MKISMCREEREMIGWDLEEEREGDSNKKMK